MYTRNEKIIPVYIEEEMKDSYINYAMSVIVGRALPDVRDGLKPVHRRILFAMKELGVEHNKPYKKSARIVGDCMGKYHPHGDVAIYDTLVRMAQDFSLRYTLVEGQGNFGSVDGDAAASMRYTEARLDRIADWMLLDIDKNTVDFMPNFDGSLREPTVLPSCLPNLLVNGSSGIAVGMATNIPPHNLKEIAEAIMFVIDDPSCDPKDLLKKVKGPDFPTGGIIRGTEGIKNAYTTGRGLLKVSGMVKIIPKGSTEAHKANINDILGEGDRIETGENGYIEIRLDNNNCLNLKPDTKLTIVKLVINPETGEFENIFEVTMGKIKARIENLKGNSKFIWVNWLEIKYSMNMDYHFRFCLN